MKNLLKTKKNNLKPEILENQQQRDEQEEQGEKIVQVALSKLYTPSIHPFKIVDDEKMQEMAESIKRYGVMTPGVARPLENGGYELISGNRRKRASELAGMETMPVIVREMDDDEAIILMVDANLQREEILPSERAFAYKLKLEAMKRQGARNDLTSRPLVGKLETADKIGEESGESGRQIQRYIRLTELIPDLLELVDEKLLAFRPAVEVSYLTKDEQEYLLESIQLNECTPSLSQAMRLKKFSQEGRLSIDVIEAIMSEEKPVERKLVLDGKWVTKHFSKEMTPKEIMERINKALKLLEQTEKRKLEKEKINSERKVNHEN